MNIKEMNMPMVSKNLDKNTVMMKDLIQDEINKGKLKTINDIKEYILMLRRTDLIQYKEDALALFKYFSIPYRKELLATAGGGGGGGGGGAGGGGAGAGGGAGSGAGAGSGGGAGPGNSSGGGAHGNSSGGGGSAGSGDTGSADSTPSMDAPRGYAFLGSMPAYSKSKKKKKKKKTSKIKIGGGIYESLDDYLMDLKFALEEVVSITKKIKYADMHMEIISDVEALAEKHGVKIDEYDINQIYKAKNNLESKIFELDQAFKDKYRDVQNKIDDENI